MSAKQNTTAIVVFLWGLSLPAISPAGSLQALERQCEDARERLIAPLRQEAIDQCITDRESGRSGTRSRRDAREHCERFYADFGQGGTTQSGGFRQRMFHDIPECQALYEAEQAGRRR